MCRLQEKSNIDKQKQLPVFKAAELAGTPAEYQKKSSTYQSEVQKSALSPPPKGAPKKAQPIFRYETQDGSPVDHSTAAAPSVKRQIGPLPGEMHVPHFIKVLPSI